MQENFEKIQNIVQKQEYIGKIFKYLEKYPNFREKIDISWIILKIVVQEEFAKQRLVEVFHLLKQHELRNFRT